MKSKIKDSEKMSENNPH